MPMTDYLRGKMYDHTLRNTAYTAPAALYVAFCKNTTVPTSATPGTPSGAGRGVLTMASAGGDGDGFNSAQVTVTGIPFGTYSYLEIWDASTSGNRLFYAAITGIALSVNGTLYVIVGNLEGTFAGAFTDY